MISLERKDNLSVPRAAVLHLSHISEWLQGVDADPDPQQWDVWARERCQFFQQEIPRPDQSKPAVRWGDEHPAPWSSESQSTRLACSENLMLTCELNTKVIWKSQTKALSRICSSFFPFCLSSCFSSCLSTYSSYFGFVWLPTLRA